MKKIVCSEIFYSLQGEGALSGTPSVFIRTFGCTLRCHGFGRENTRGKVLPLDNSVAIAKLKSLADIPIPDVGCDSYPSWDKRFLHLHTSYTVTELVAAIHNVTPAGIVPDVIFTGGEPLLKGNQSFFVAVFNELAVDTEINGVTFETNGTVPLTSALSEYIVESDITFTFSVSPKLSNSGEHSKDAHKPDAIASYLAAQRVDSSTYVYFKFVVDTEDRIPEIEEYMDGVAHVKSKQCIYLMPEGGTASGLAETETLVALLCLKYGYKFCTRLHIHVFGNAWKT